MKIATYEAFCLHYELDLTSDESREEYQKYIDMITFTDSLFLDVE